MAPRMRRAMISSRSFRRTPVVTFRRFAFRLGSALSIVSLHLIKLCVGCDSVKDLEGWIRERLKDRRKRGLSREHMHRTRMVPKRADELTDGGSLYWVIRGQVMCRQRLLDVRPFVDKAGRRPLPLGAGAEAHPGRAPALAGVPGLALPRAEGRAARSRPRRARRQEHAGDAAPRVARVRPPVTERRAR